MMDRDELRTLDDVALVSRAVDHQLGFKSIHDELQRRPTSEASAAALVAAYREGRAAPWLTAFLLGGCRHALGYATVREILLSAPGQLAESYAGPALARIRGGAALEDLRELLMNAPKRASREGAAYGLSELGSPPAKVAIRDATLSGRIRVRTGAWILGRLDPDPQWILERLATPGDLGVRLGTEILWSCIKSVVIGAPEDARPPLAMRPGEELLRAVETVVGNAAIPMHPRKRADLRAWLEDRGATQPSLRFP